MNFYQLGTMLHLKSIAILEELEAVTILPPSIEGYFLPTDTDIQQQQTKKRKNLPSSDSIIITAGEKGILRFFKLQHQVILFFFSFIKIILKI